VVDAPRLALRIHQQVLGAVHEAQRRGIELAVGAARLARAVRRRDRARVGRLVAEGARRVDRAEQQLQHVQARQVWKPLLCALMPRMACIATGRPGMSACARRANRSRRSAATACCRRRRRRARARRDGSYPRDAAALGHGLGA
jgi:hypothetical protein